MKKLLFVLGVAAGNLATSTVDAAVRYDFNALSAGRGVTGHFTYITDDFITGFVDAGDLKGQCYTSLGARCAGSQTFFRSVYDQVGFRPEQGYTNYYYFSPNAFSEYGRHDTVFLGSWQAATLTVSQVAATVPEPATWAMMLIGFGLIGATARYRKRRTTVALV